MKHVTVPAQVTSVEDKIAGSLTLSQLLLLASPILVDLLLFWILPIQMKLGPVKLVLMTGCLLGGVLASIRVKGKLMLAWATLIIRYNLRAGYYVFNKNSLYLRYVMQDIAETEVADDLKPPLKTRAASSVKQRNVSQAAIDTSRLSFSFHKKRGLHVSISEID